jgi:hypothetical protein
MGYSRIRGIALSLLTKLIIVDAHAFESFVLNMSEFRQHGRVG